MGDDIIARDNLCNLDVRQRFQAAVKRGEIGFDCASKQFLKTRDHEVILLIIVNAIFGAHHAFEVEADAIGAWVIERENAFAKARHDASAIDAETRRLSIRPNSTVYQ